ncbi:aminoglycoside phosphotransferase family protein [Streptomyces carpaticus]|uniref:phosphotransferase family protein n=1 Tax=Streptomyces carpaticus TaxID=285558 RepID=UPI0022079444|nr:aminoglycoside phosphotransferase family protein [Streptomyces carpaticus]
MKAVTESITKNRQPEPVLRTMTQRAFGAHRVPEGQGWAEELGHGWFNVAYLIRLRDGLPVVLKIAPPPGVEVMTYERGMMRNEVTALSLVRRETSVPVPAVYHYDDSHELCGADHFFMEYIDADNLGVLSDRLTPGEQQGYQRLIGATTRTLNRVPGPHFGPLTGPVPGRTTWREVFTGLVADVLRDGEHRAVDLGVPYATVRSLLAAWAGCLDAVTEPVLVEWDLWPGNVMVRDGALAAVIDHERALYGDPLMEAGFAACRLDGFGDPAGFLHGYGKPALTPDEDARRRLYDLHLMLVMVIETVYRGHTDPAQYDFARAGLARAVDALAPGAAVRPGT